MKHLAATIMGALLAANAPADETPPSQGKTYEVYFLGGQSNMEGFGFVADLPEAVGAAAAKVPIFHGKTAEDGRDGGGIGFWAPLQPGHGTGFDTDGETMTVSDRFGPEMTFASTMAQSGRNLAIIKYSRGGTGLIDGVSGYGSWDPDYAKGNRRNQYDFALAAIGEALRARDIDGDGAIDRLVPAGIVWMQGEADAYDSPTASANYAANLARLMALFRAALHRDDLPLVIGRIRDSGETPDTRVMTYSPEVRAAQQRFVELDPCAALVTVSDGFEFLPDGWHYTSKDYVALGTAFAGAMVDLQTRC
jgi:Carbohydrate esterase, sialic acid-specific acetylesterase